MVAAVSVVRVLVDSSASNAVGTMRLKRLIKLSASRCYLTEITFLLIYVNYFCLKLYWLIF